MNKRRVAPLLTIVACCGTLLQAGGPLVDVPSSAYRWNPALPIRYAVDPGPLADDGNIRLENSDGLAVIQQAFDTWSQTAEALVFENGGFLPADVDETNFFDFADPNDPFEGGNPIVFDADGAITADLFGMESVSFILGFAGSVDSDGDGFFDYGQAVFNGTRASLEENSSFRSTVLHEVGHLVGLDHTEAGNELFDRCVGGEGDVCARIPVMYPISIGGAPAYPAVPLPDDAAWISWLYPSAQAPETGSIRGFVKRRSGVAFQGADVVAVPVTRGESGALIESDDGRVSCVSDFLYAWDGSYLLPGLAPGEYVVFVEPLDPSFDGGSRVGPFPDRYEAFPRDYFNGENESGDPETDDPMERVVVQVAAGQVVANVNFVSNDADDEVPGNRLSDLGDDDTRGFIFPGGFTFPFLGRFYRGVFLNSDGNLTFDDHEILGGLPRDERRFLGGRPRIAPLYNDLNPRRGGTVAASFDDRSLTFAWDRVPEFGAAPGNSNTFLVTLHSSGDIEFDYGEISLAPTTLAARAVVGVSPGGRESGQQSQIFSLPQPIPLADEAVYEVFRGSGPLGVSALRFQAAPLSRLLFPFYMGDAQNFTGFAVTNDSEEDVDIQVEARANDGTLQNYPDNPHIESLGTGRQFARVGSEFFGLAPTALQDGWVRMSSAQSQLASFFQFGTVDSGVVTRLDGSVAQTEPSPVLYFTRVYDGPDSFPAPTGSPQDAETLFAVANPNAEAISLTFTYLGPMGQPMAGPVQRNLNALGCLRESFTSLFGSSVGVVSDGFVRVEASGGGAVGFELIVLENALLGFNASAGNARTVSYSAQLAHGEAGGIGIYTSLKLVNVSDQPRRVTLTPLGNDGTQIGPTVFPTLFPNQTLQRTVGNIFGFGPPTGPSVAGSIRVEADGPGVVGDVIFGDPATLRYAAALPLQTSLLSRAIFSQVANAVGPSNAASTFTGLAFHNPNAQSVMIRISVFGEDGVPTGDATLTLAAGARISEVLTALIPDTVGQVRGFILIEAFQQSITGEETPLPIVAQQLFGNLTLGFLSAVPPTIFE